MNPDIVLQQTRVNPEIKYLLAVSIVFPVQAAIPKNQLESRLKLLELKVEERLATLYSEKQTTPLITKLKHIIGNLDFRTHKKGIAIFVSSVSEKVYYLEGEVEEKITIDEFFEFHDEIFRKKEDSKISYHYTK
jgi:hypothetical protein